MSDEEKSFWGCLGSILIGLLIGVAIRSQDFKQFLAMFGQMAIGIIALVWGLSSLSEEGCLNRLWATFCGLVTLTMVIAIGAFLITGDYERATRIATWNVRTPTPGPEAPAQVEITPTATPTPNPTLPPTATPTPKLTLTPTAIPTPGIVSTPVSTSIALVAGGQPWLAETNVSVGRVTGALNEIWGASGPDVVQIANRLNAGLEMASVEGKYAAGLLIAAAHERAEDLDAAYFAYEQVKEEAADTPYATSADVRLRFLPIPEPTSSAESGEEAEELNPLERLQRMKGRERKDPEETCEAMMDEPDADGWFLLSDQWMWDTTRRAAAQDLIRMRADKLSVRFFQFLRSKSPFPTSYAYMFILLVMTIGAKLLALPLYVRTAKATVQVRRLVPTVQEIQRTYQDDPMTAQQHVMRLYREHGVNLWSGCAVSIVDIIFVIWALVSLGSFSPQLVLDGAAFQWVSDVTRYDLGIMLVWAIASLIGTIVTGAPRQVGQQIEQQFGQQFGQQLGQQRGLSTAVTSCSFVIGSVITIAIARRWDWPAYVFIFWTQLLILGTLISSVLTMIWRAISGSHNRLR